MCELYVSHHSDADESISACCTNDRYARAARRDLNIPDRDKAHASIEVGGRTPKRRTSGSSTSMSASQFHLLLQYSYAGGRLVKVAQVWSGPSSFGQGSPPCHQGMDVRS